MGPREDDFGRHRSPSCVVCGSETVNCCSGCLVVFYCCADHQQRHWDQRHKDECHMLRDASTVHITPDDLVNPHSNSNKFGFQSSSRNPSSAINDSILDERNTLRTESVMNLRQSQNAVAADRALRAYRIGLSFYGHSHPDMIPECITLARAMTALSDLEEAERYTRETRLLAQNQPYSDPSLNAALYSIVGELYVLQGNVDDAQRAYCVYLALMTEYFGENHLAASDAYTLMSSFCRRVGLFLKALEFSERALTIRMQQLGPFHSSTCDSHYNCGVLQRMCGNTGEALRELEISLKQRLGDDGVTSLSVADAYLGMGACEHDLGQYESAWERYLMAFQIRKELLGEEHPTTVDVGLYLSALRRDMQSIQ